MKVFDCRNIAISKDVGWETTCTATRNECHTNHCRERTATRWKGKVRSQRKRWQVRIPRDNHCEYTVVGVGWCIGCSNGEIRRIWLRANLKILDRSLELGTVMLPALERGVAAASIHPLKRVWQKFYAWELIERGEDRWWVACARVLSIVD